MNCRSDLCSGPKLDVRRYRERRSGVFGTLRGRALSNVLLQDVRSGHERGDADRVLDGVTLLHILTGIVDCRGDGSGIVRTFAAA